MPVENTSNDYQRGRADGYEVACGRVWRQDPELAAALRSVSVSASDTAMPGPTHAPLERDTDPLDAFYADSPVGMLRDYLKYDSGLLPQPPRKGDREHLTRMLLDQLRALVRDAPAAAAPQDAEVGAGPVDAADQAGAAPVLPAGARWMTIEPEGYDEHATADEARAAAESWLEEPQPRDDSWHENIEATCWGYFVPVEVAERYDVRPPAHPSENDCLYRLRPAAVPSAPQVRSWAASPPPGVSEEEARAVLAAEGFVDPGASLASLVADMAEDRRGALAACEGYRAAGASHKGDTSPIPAVASKPDARPRRAWPCGDVGPDVTQARMALVTALGGIVPAPVCEAIDNLELALGRELAATQQDRPRPLRVLLQQWYRDAEADGENDDRAHGEATAYLRVLNAVSTNTDPLLPDDEDVVLGLKQRWGTAIGLGEPYASTRRLEQVTMALRDALADLDPPLRQLAAQVFEGEKPDRKGPRWGLLHFLYRVPEREPIVVGRADSGSREPHLSIASAELESWTGPARTIDELEEMGLVTTTRGSTAGSWRTDLGSILLAHPRLSAWRLAAQAATVRSRLRSRQEKL